jgi:hypothetical protein
LRVKLCNQRTTIGKNEFLVFDDLFGFEERVVKGIAVMCNEHWVLAVLTNPRKYGLERRIVLFAISKLFVSNVCQCSNLGTYRKVEVTAIGN